MLWNAYSVMQNLLDTRRSDEDFRSLVYHGFAAAMGMGPPTITVHKLALMTTQQLAVTTRVLKATKAFNEFVDYSR